MSKYLSKSVRWNKYLKYSVVLIGLSISCQSNQGPAQMPPQQVEVVEVQSGQVPLHKIFVGQTYGLLDIPIRARVEGFLEGRHFEEGSPVSKNQLLYTIDSQPFMAEVAAQQSSVAEAKTMLVNAENELNRYKPLAEISAVSKSDLDAAQASYEAAIAGVQAAEANLELAKINLSYTKIYSPIDGLIGKTEARRGEFVGREPNPVILNTVSRIDTIRVQFYLIESEYLTIVKGILSEEEQKRIENRTASKNERKRNIELFLADGSVYEHKGWIDFVDRNVDPTTGSMLVQASFPNPDALLRPGLFAKVKIQHKILDNAILVPQRAVMEIQGNFSVYVVNDSNKVESRPVIPGETKGDMWLINEGLNAGEKIVIEGLQKVRTGMAVAPELTEFKSQSN